MDSLDDHVCDDDLAIGPLNARGVAVERVSWQRRDVRWGEFDWVIVRSTWDYQSDVDAFVETLAAIDRTPAQLANPLSTMIDNIDKRYLRTLAHHGVPIVPTEFGDQLDLRRLRDLLAGNGTRRCVIKPVVSAGSHNTFVISNAMTDDELRPAVAAHSHSEWMLQPFVDAVVDPGEYSVFLFDGEVSHAILKTPASGDFRVQEEFGGDIRGIEPGADLLAAARAAYAAIGTRLLHARIDLVELDGRYCLMEAELIEPSLYLRCSSDAPERFADACISWFGESAGSQAPRKLA